MARWKNFASKEEAIAETNVYCAEFALSYFWKAIEVGKPLDQTKRRLY